MKRPGGRGTHLMTAGVIVLILVGMAVAQPPATNVDDPRVYEVGSQLRCVVCQNLSVADSPSEMAHQMRVIVRERLAAGDTPDQVIQYFVDKYGEWILLKPRRHGFNWLLWLAPAIAVAIGLTVFVIVVRRWTRRPPAMAPGPLDPAMRERIRKELELEREP